MQFQFVTLTFLIHVVTSIFCLSRCKKKLSFILEIIISVVMIFITIEKLQSKEIEVIIFANIFEYIAAKIMILCLVVLLKAYSFIIKRSLASNGILSKICSLICGKSHLKKIASNFLRLKYGPRLKLGIPELAGKEYKQTGIKFDSQGFPIFKSLYTFHIRDKEYKKNRNYLICHANIALYQTILHDRELKRNFSKQDLELFKNGKIPKTYIWHFHQDRGIMQLVDSEAYSKVPHIDGLSFW